MSPFAVRWAWANHLAQALGHAACRAGYRVLFSRADGLLKTLARSRADNSFDRELRSFIRCNLLVVDDLVLKKTIEPGHLRLL